jgi:hypothetical protein
LQKLKPEFAILVDLIDTPPTPIVRVLVVLANSDPKSYRDDKWTVKKIKALIKAHAWPEEGIDGAIDQLLRSETLTWRSGYLRFFRDRVKVVEHAQPLWADKVKSEAA